MRYAIAMLLLSGCITGTAHEYCQANLHRYGSYDQCYAERQAAINRQGHALSHMGDPLINAGQAGQQAAQQQPVRCTSYRSGDQTYTTCR